MSTEIKFTNDYFIKFFDLLKELSENITIFFDFEACSFNVLSMDSCQVCVFQTSFVNAFTVVKSEQKDREISVNILQLLNILKCKEKSETYSISFDDDCVYFLFNNEEDGNDYQKYTLRLIDMESSSFAIDNFGDNVSISMESKYLSSLCKKLGNFGESIVFETKDNGSDLYIKSENDEAELKITKKAEVTVSESDISVKLLLKYVAIFAKAEKFSDTVYIKSQCNEAPMEFIYIFGENFIKFVIGPQL